MRQYFAIFTPMKTVVKKAKLLYDARAILGEGPVWDYKKQLLFWVDIEDYKLQQHNPLTKENKHWVFNDMIGAAVPMQNGNLLLAMESGLASFDCESEKITKHNVLENSEQLMRYNDGKIGPDGNFWIGSMHKQFVSGSGNLFKVSKGFKSTVQIPKTTISNGMAWSADKKTFFYIDSPTFTIRSYDFDLAKSSISNEKIVITVPKEYGSPDGMSIDEEGMLWVAHWGGNCIRRWNPTTGKVLEKIEVDARQVTSCCFGGKDLKTLYITTARGGLDEKQLQEHPHSGGLFVHETNIKGTPINYF